MRVLGPWIGCDDEPPETGAPVAGGRASGHL